ncbi:hypothetical protein [Mycobacteroides abscessus]
MQIEVPDNPLQPCWEQIPYESAPSDVLVREAFWYAAALFDAGWTIQSVTAEGFTGMAPGGATIDLQDCAGITDELALLFTGQLAALAQLDVKLLGELDPLIKKRARSGPIPRPARFSTVAEIDVMNRLRAATTVLDFKRAFNELQEAHEKQLQLLNRTREGSGLAAAIKNMLEILRGFDARTAGAATTLSTKTMVASVVGWASFYDISQDYELHPQPQESSTRSPHPQARRR